MSGLHDEKTGKCHVTLSQSLIPDTVVCNSNNRIVEELPAADRRMIKDVAPAVDACSGAVPPVHRPVAVMKLET